MPDNEGQAKIRVDVQGAPESKNLLKGVLEVIKDLGSTASKTAATDLRGLWDAFKEGKDKGDTLSGVFNLLKASINGHTAALAAGIGVYAAYRTAAVAAAEKTMDMYKSLRQLQATAGGTIEEVQALQNAFALMGVPAETLTIAMFRLGAAIESGAVSIRRLGIDTRDTAGNLKDPIAVFEELRDKLSKVGSDAERSTILREVLGRQGARLAPVFKADAAAFKEYLERGKEMAAIDEHLAEMTVELMKSGGELELQQKKFNAMLAEQAGIPIKIWWDELTAGVYKYLNAMLAHDQALAKRRAFGKETGTLFGGWAAGWSSTVQEAVDAREQADKLEKQAKAAQEKTTTISPEQRKEREADLKHEREMANLRIKARGEAAAETAKIETATASASTAAKLAENQELVDEEQKSYADRMALLRAFFKNATDEQFRNEKEVQALTREHEKKLFELEAAGEKERRKLYQDQVKDAEVAMERKLKVDKATSDMSVKLLEAREAEELAVLSTSEDTKAEVAERTEQIKESSVRQTAATRMAVLDEEIAGWVRMAALYQDNAEVQVKANEKILESTSKRAAIEIDTNRKIIDDRKQMVEKLKQQEQEKAGVGASLEEKALSSLKKQGFSSINSQMVKAEASRLYQWGEYYAKEYDRGGALSPEQLEYARDWQGIAQKMRDVGEGGGGMYAQTVGQIYEGGTGRAIGAAERARGAAYGLRSPYSPSVSTSDVSTVISEIPKQTKKALEDIKSMLAGEGVGGASLANTIKDMIVRALEFEAARQ
jgi:hypothetical protein